MTQVLEQVLSVLFPPSLPSDLDVAIAESPEEHGSIGKPMLRYHDALDRIDWMEWFEEVL
jgi:hypothetical protein